MNRKNGALLLDPTNIEILEALVAEPRATNAELARSVGMSGPAVRERVQRLEESGIIRGFRIELDGRSLGYPLEVFVRVRPIPGQLPKIVALAQKTPQIVECHRITGEDCVIMRLFAQNVDALGPLLDAFLVYGQTTTSLVQSTPVPLRSLPVPRSNGTRAKRSKR